MLNEIGPSPSPIESSTDPYKTSATSPKLKINLHIHKTHRHSPLRTNLSECVLVLNWVVVLNMFCFHPENWGRWTHFDEHILQRGLVQNPSTSKLGGGNSTIFNFHPEPWGNDPIWQIFFKGLGEKPPTRNRLVSGKALHDAVCALGLTRYFGVPFQTEVGS